MFCFVEVMQFKISMNKAISKDLPGFVKNLFKVFHVVRSGSVVLNEYMANNAQYSSDETNSDDDGGLTLPYDSPHKSGTKRKDATTTATNKRSKSTASTASA